MFTAMFERMRALYGSSYSYWLLFVAAALSFSGYYAMQLRLHSIPRKGRWLDPGYLLAATFFFIGSLLWLDIILELFGIDELTTVRHSVESLLSIDWIR